MELACSREMMLSQMTESEIELAYGRDMTQRERETDRKRKCV